MAPTVNAADGAGPPADPTGIELRYSHQHHWDTSNEDMPELWHVSADIPDAQDDDGQSVNLHVGDIQIARVDPYRGDAFDLLDGHSIDLARIGEVVLDIGAGGLDSELEDRIDGHGSDLLILDRVRLASDWRGYSIGVLLAGVAIQRLSGGCQAALCIPGPLTDDDGESPREEDLHRTRQREYGWLTSGHSSASSTSATTSMSSTSPMPPSTMPSSNSANGSTATGERR